MKALKEYNLDFHQQDAKCLFDYFDRDHDGIINYEEFLYSLRVHAYLCNKFIYFLKGRT